MRLRLANLLESPQKYAGGYSSNPGEYMSNEHVGRFGILPQGVALVRERKARSGRAVTAHVLGRLSSPLKRELARKLAAAGKDDLRIVNHRPRTLLSAGSLAAFEARFGEGRILYDPTAIFVRTAEVVRCAKLIRQSLGRKVDKILFHSSRRTLVVVLEAKAFKGNGQPFRRETADAMESIHAAFENWRREAPRDFALAVRVGFDAPPRLPVVAVDDFSHVRPFGRFAKRFKSVKTVVGIAALGGAAIAPAAAYAQMTGDQGDPTAAVALPNFSVLAQGDFLDRVFGSHDAGRFDGAAVGDVPLGHDLGFQAEAGAGTRDYYGFGGHLFWRDPDWGMLGGVVSYESEDHVNLTRYGGEAEIYLDQFTLSGRIGDQTGENVASGLYGRADVSFYLTPSFVIRGGYEGSPGLTLGHAVVEFQPVPEAWSGLSLFADGKFGNATQVMAGVKLHFGASGASLMWRDRHEDPDLAIFNIVAPKKSHYVTLAGVKR